MTVEQLSAFGGPEGALMAAPPVASVSVALRSACPAACVRRPAKEGWGIQG